MEQNQFPEGWDEERVRRVIAHYDNQTEDEQVAEDETRLKMFDALTREIGEEYERLGITEEELMAELKETRREVFNEKYPKFEAELLMKINQGIPVEIQQRYNELIAKRQDENMTDGEYAELMRLTHQVEEMDAQRIAYLAELANLRGTSLTALMDSLGITTSPYV